MAYDKGIRWIFKVFRSMAILNKLIISKMNALNENSIVVGVDVHKYSHTAVAMNAWGEEKGKLDFSNNNLGTCANWLNSLGIKENIVIGLEDVNSYGAHLVEKLRQDSYHTLNYETLSPSF